MQAKQILPILTCLILGGLMSTDVQGWEPTNDKEQAQANFRIHDRNTSSKDYSTRLETIINRLQKTGARLTWVTTTPVPVGAQEYREGSIKRLNEVAAALMNKHAIPVIDMNREITQVLTNTSSPKIATTRMKATSLWEEL